MDQKLRTERRKLADLKAAEYNPRKALTPDDAEYQKIRRSIEEFGYVDPMERLEKNAIEILHMMCERSECIICDSGGKDSSVLKHIALQAKEKYGLQFRVRHNHTTVDAPETVYFVREEKRKFEQMGIPYEIHYPKESMWQLIVRHVTPPTRLMRYCCVDLKENQFEVEIYPQFKKMDEVPPEGRSIKKDNDKAQRNLNDKNARKYVERLINENFTDRDLWLTFTYDNEHLPPDGDIDAAIKNVQKFIRRVNYQRKKRGLPNARYVYVTAYNPTEEIRWHHHIVMDGDMDMDVVEGCWKQSSRNEVRRLQKDENGLTGMAKYIVEEKNRVKSEKRWNSSQGLRDPDIKVVHSKRPTAKAGGYKKIGTYVETMRKGHEQVREQMLKWYPDFDFTDAGIYYNDFNSMFYIRARMRKRRQQ